MKKRTALSTGKEKGFTLIELLIVVAIIGILAAIAIPGYIGMQEKSRKGAITRSATSVIPELQAWLMAARSVEDIVEIDTNFDATIAAPGDDTNSALQAYGVAKRYKENRITAMQESSPWNSNVRLWINDDTDTADPNVPELAKKGVINIISGTQGLRVVARDNQGNILINRVVSAD